MGANQGVILPHALNRIVAAQHFGTGVDTIHEQGVNDRLSIIPSSSNVSASAMLT